MVIERRRKERKEIRMKIRNNKQNREKHKYIYSISPVSNRIDFGGAHKSNNHRFEFQKDLDFVDIL